MNPFIIYIFNWAGGVPCLEKQMASLHLKSRSGWTLISGDYETSKDIGECNREHFFLHKLLHLLVRHGGV